MASYGGDSDSDGEEEAPPDVEKLIDWAKIACLLCKRQFSSKDVLTKHLQLSDLHKKNVDALMSKYTASVANRQVCTRFVRGHSPEMCQRALYGRRDS